MEQIQRELKSFLSKGDTFFSHVLYPHGEPEALAGLTVHVADHGPAGQAKDKPPDAMADHPVRRICFDPSIADDDEVKD